MKKAYIKPRMSAMALDSSQMLATSGPSGMNVNDSATTGTLDGNQAWSNERAWGNNLWETPEEEEK